MQSISWLILAHTVSISSFCFVFLLSFLIVTVSNKKNNNFLLKKNTCLLRGTCVRIHVFLHLSLSISPARGRSLKAPERTCWCGWPSWICSSPTSNTFQRATSITRYSSSMWGLTVTAHAHTWKLLIVLTAWGKTLLRSSFYFHFSE